MHVWASVVRRCARGDICMMTRMFPAPLSSHARLTQCSPLLCLFRARSLCSPSSDCPRQAYSVLPSPLTARARLTQCSPPLSAHARLTQCSPPLTACAGLTQCSPLLCLPAPGSLSAPRSSVCPHQAHSVLPAPLSLPTPGSLSAPLLCLPAPGSLSSSFPSSPLSASPQGCLGLFFSFLYISPWRATPIAPNVDQTSGPPKKSYGKI